MRKTVVLAIALLTSPNAFSIREHMLDFPETELEKLELPAYFAEDQRLSIVDGRMSPAPEALRRDDAQAAKDYVLQSNDLKKVLGAKEFKAMQGRREKMKATLEELYQNAGRKAADKLLKPNAGAEPKDQTEDRLAIERRNEKDRSATIALTELVADYMEYNQKKRVAFRSTCLEELGVPGAQDPGHQVDINYMVYDFDRYERLSELKYYGAPADKGPILLLPGRAEPSYKWVEFAHELYRRGYGPIISLDHRGQGLSSRVPWVVGKDKTSYTKFIPTNFSQNPGDVHNVGHVDLFRCYIDDVNTFMTKVAQPILDAWHLKYPNKKHYKTEDLILMGHSTGGAIAQGYLMQAAMDHTENPGSAAVIPKNVFLISPMFGLSALNAAKGAVGKFFSRQDKKPRPKLSLSGAWNAITSAASSVVNLADCKLNSSCLDIASRAGISANLVHDPLNITTHSAARYLQYRVMINLWPEAKVAAISTNWLQEAGLFFNLLHNDPHEYKQTALRIYVGGDAAGLEGERVVDNKAVVKYCKEMGSDFKECEVIPFGNLPKAGLSGARHALHSEDDWYREQMLRDIDVTMGTPFLLHDMLVRCEEDNKITWHQELSTSAKTLITDIKVKKALQKQLADNCVIQACRKFAPEKASAAVKKAIDKENSECLVNDFKNRGVGWDRHRIPKIFTQVLK